MSSKKPLNIGMIGYGFMGRAHSNAYCRVGNFFDLEYEPVLKAVCARNEDNARTFADNWGFRGDPKGRLLAVMLLEALATERANAALHAIDELVRNQGITADELSLIRTASRSAAAKVDRTLPGHTGD